MKSAVALLAMLAATSLLVAVRADDFDEDFAPPTRAARGGARSQGRGAGAGGGGGGAASEGGAGADGGGKDGAGAVATAKGERRGVEEITFVVEHSLAIGAGGDADAFKPCGVFSARAHYDRNNQEAMRLSHVKLQRDPADEDFVAAFTKLVDNDLHYRVRLPANVLHPREGGGNARFDFFIHPDSRL